MKRKRGIQKNYFQYIRDLITGVAKKKKKTQNARHDRFST